jgi:hypothetical protein
MEPDAGSLVLDRFVGRAVLFTISAWIAPYPTVLTTLVALAASAPVGLIALLRVVSGHENDLHLIRQSLMPVIAILWFIMALGIAQGLAPESLKPLSKVLFR